MRGKIIICLEGSASRERFAEFFVIVITKNFVGVTRLTFEKIIFLLYHVITRLGKEGISMEQDRVRIVDVADALGLSTATVSKVIHGKTEKISDETIKRVQQELERSGYIPNMAGI